VEQDGQLWIGGRPWRKLGDSGLFRLDLASGKLRRYGPRDGFRYARHDKYECYDGVWANGRLWVATSFGLAEISMRDPSEPDEETPIEKYAKQIQPLLPKGWSVAVTGNIVRLRRDKQVLTTSLHGRPPANPDESDEERLQRIGSLVSLEIDLRFIPRLTQHEHRTRSAQYKMLQDQGKSVFRDKVRPPLYLEMLEQNKLPIYFTQEFSILVDGVPPQFTMHDDSAYRELKQMFANINTLLDLYEGAEPVPY
jgi:hypothetical protein